MTLNLTVPNPITEAPCDPRTDRVCPSIGKYLYRRLSEKLKAFYRWQQATQRYDLVRAIEVSPIATQRRRCDAHPEDHDNMLPEI